jgi:hypothetical protein
MSDSWLGTSWGEVEEAAKNADRNFSYFSLSTGETRRVRILEEAPHSIRRHFVQKDGRKYYTCLQGTDVECPLCIAGNKSAFAGFFTVIDYEDDKNEDGTAKPPMSRIKQARFGIRALRSLMGCVQRYGAVNTYDLDITCANKDEGIYNFVPIGAGSENPISDDYKDAEPLDHESLLKPNSPEELRAVVASLVSSPAPPAEGVEGAEKTIKFM